MIGITRSGEIIKSECFTGEELVAVILTKADDKPELVSILQTDVFPRMGSRDDCKEVLAPFSATKFAPRLQKS